MDGKWCVSIVGLESPMPTQWAVRFITNQAPVIAPPRVKWPSIFEALMLHEELPVETRFAIGPSHLSWYRGGRR